MEDGERRPGSADDGTKTVEGGWTRGGSGWTTGAGATHLGVHDGRRSEVSSAVTSESREQTNGQRSPGRVVSDNRRNGTTTAATTTWEKRRRVSSRDGSEGSARRRGRGSEHVYP